MIQTHIFYSGTVQGVGFRYAVLNNANALGLWGWVRNLPDGRVEILIEGKKESIDTLQQHIEEHFEGYIKDKTVEILEPQNRFKDFKILT